MISQVTRDGHKDTFKIDTGLWFWHYLPIQLFTPAPKFGYRLAPLFGWVGNPLIQCYIVIVWVKTSRLHQKDVKPGSLDLTPVPNLYNLYLPHLNLCLTGLAVIHWYQFLFALLCPGDIRISVSLASWTPPYVYQTDRKIDSQAQCSIIIVIK